MKIFFDTEFTELSKDTELITLGMVSEDNKCFYAVFTDYDKSKVSDFVKDYVLPYIKLPKEMITKYSPIICTGTKSEIRKELLEWLKSFDTTIELVSDVCHYDMVLFVDIFGTSNQFPYFICPACYDINMDILRLLDETIVKSQPSMNDAFDYNREELLTTLYYDDIPKYSILNMTANKHNSLYDALVIKELYDELNLY